MCLIASYTETEKLNQVQKVNDLMALPLDTEEKKKNFLYNLSFMNSMVVKGYKMERTEADNIIYSTKDNALNLLIKVMPDRCHVQDSCMYVYAGGRQYSYHFRTNNYTGHNANLISFYLRDERKEVKWDEIKEGFMLSDEEYKTRYNEHKDFYRNLKQREQEDEARETKEFERNARIYLLRCIKEARRVNEEKRQHNAHFWDIIEHHLTKAQKRTKAYANRDGYKLRKLYGEKLGLTWRDEPRMLETSPVPTFNTETGWPTSYDEHCIYDRMRQLYDELKHKGLKKYII